MKKRLMSLILAVLMLLGAVGALAEAAPMEGVELTIWAGQRSNVESLVNNRFTDYYEQLTGVHVNWIAYVDELPTQFNLSIASGDYPDLYTNYDFTTAQVQQAIDAGAAIPIEDYLAEYAPNYSRLLEMDPDLKAEMTAPDGHIYSFPRYVGINNYVASHKLWIYEPWLKASGLSMPTTLEELEQLLIYFRDNDMNGNGKDDEIPMIGSSMILNQASDPVIPVIDCFEVVTDNWLRADSDGNITTMATTDNFRAGLSYANKLYEEGLIGEETYTQNINTHRTNNSPATDDQVYIGVTGGPDFARFVTAAYPNRYRTWTFIPPLKKDADSQPQTILQPRRYVPKSLVTTACENPEAAVKWLDMGLDPVIQITSAFGFEGEHWTRVSESPETGIVFQLTDKSLYAEGAATQNQTWSLDWWELPTYQGQLYTPFTQQYKEGTDAYYQGTKEKAATDAYTAVATDSGMPYGNVWITDADLDAERAELATLIEEYVKRSYTEFVMGIRDVDDDAVWQEYLNELDAMGMEHYMDVCEAFYFGK